MPDTAVHVIFDPHVSNALVALACTLLILIGLSTWIASDRKHKAVSEEHWHYVIEDGIKTGYPCTGFGCDHCRREEAAKAPPQTAPADLGLLFAADNGKDKTMCFSLASVEHLLIWIAVIVAVFAIIRVLLGLISPPAAFAWLISAAVQIVQIVLWLAVVIAIIVVLFALLSCVIPFPALR